MRKLNARGLPDWSENQELQNHASPHPAEPAIRVLTGYGRIVPKKSPQQGFIFRLIAFLAHLQLIYLVKSAKHWRLFLILYVFFKGAVALGIITAVAFVTHFPLLFPPLGPSAFILFNTPMSPNASPKNVILSHTVAALSGLTALHLLVLIFPEAHLSNPQILSWPRVAVIGLAMGLTGALILALRCPHPPAAATALIVALGYFETPIKVLGLLLALVLLVLQAFLFNRILGGMPYPLWKCDPKIARDYGELAGIGDETSSFWQRLTIKVFQRR
ncbi:MAG: HPP family protein [Candidatus Eisenbacteria bacterium]|uniref:HPP family protein n=1 Tax=Eiseniibacteriota bacterium TaxID=2212470 RepID=A0A948RUT6_UNCEI|nr:HPP family protein [Candidatus Eisenbacteria bacterium]MBU1950438.1 HPP family protein [Candidatus Eisenbacteria bacterium]MBU2690104.1 HPP family protein [Candidatus Eisenbacteria bacterium]